MQEINEFYVYLDEVERLDDVEGVDALDEVEYDDVEYVE